MTPELVTGLVVLVCWVIGTARSKSHGHIEHLPPDTKGKGR